MKMLIQFDIDADIIDVPENIVEDRELMRCRFLKWLYSKDVKHKYRVKVRDDNGTYYALQYRSDAFVDWLNKKVLKQYNEKAKVIKQCVIIDEFVDEYPSIWF